MKIKLCQTCLYKYIAQVTGYIRYMTRCYVGFSKNEKKKKRKKKNRYVGHGGNRTFFSFFSFF